MGLVAIAMGHFNFLPVGFALPRRSLIALLRAFRWASEAWLSSMPRCTLELRRGLGKVRAVIHVAIFKRRRGAHALVSLGSLVDMVDLVDLF